MPCGIQMPYVALMTEGVTGGAGWDFMQAGAASGRQAPWHRVEPCKVGTDEGRGVQS